MIIKDIRDILTTNIISASPEIIVSDAIALMTRSKISALVLTNNDQIEGIFTERDIVRLADRRDEFKEIQVKEFMSKPVLTTSIDNDIYDVYGLLKENKIRHVVVVDSKGRMAGIISQTDIMNNLGMDFFVEYKTISELMVQNVQTIKKDLLLLDAFSEMGKNSISCISIGNDITERKLAEKQMKAERQKFFTILDRLPAFICLMTEDKYITYCNQSFKDSFEDGVGKLCYDVFSYEKDQCEVCGVTPDRETKVPNIWEWEDKSRIYQIYNYPFIDADNTPLILKLGMDITKRKKAETGRETLIKDLEKALSTIKTLKGFIPICASCKKIRDDSGYWNQLEKYISEHSDAEFTHGICPECIELLYPDSF